MNPAQFQRIKNEISHELNGAAKDTNWQPIGPDVLDQTAHRWPFISTSSPKYKIECSIEEESRPVKGIEEPFLVCKISCLNLDSLKSEGVYLGAPFPPKEKSWRLPLGKADRQEIPKWARECFEKFQADCAPPKKSKTGK